MDAVATARPSLGRQSWNFGRHFLEMCIAMCVGGAILGVLVFAAASLVRFRTNIRDPKEITVLLICLGVGLAAGVGRWDMAVILTLFVLLALSILEYFEQSQVWRSMEVCVQTRNVDRTNEVLKQVFAGHKVDSELRELDREDKEDPIGIIVFLVNLDTSPSTNLLSEEIFKADPENIDSVEWDQKESNTYMYR